MEKSFKEITRARNEFAKCQWKEIAGRFFSTRSILSRDIYHAKFLRTLCTATIARQLFHSNDYYCEPGNWQCVLLNEFLIKCALRLDERVNSEERSILARDITLNLSLFECKDSLIRTLSGGEKKRLSLAAETVTKPQILYLDEPTTGNNYGKDLWRISERNGHRKYFQKKSKQFFFSGLDTSAALHVVESIKQNSTKGIVICSIHQPSMMIYKLFSHVIFLTEGKVAFAGRLKDARAFFERYEWK